MKYLVWSATILSGILLVFFFGILFMNDKNFSSNGKIKDPKLLLAFEKMRKKRGESYRPRTRHLDAKGKALFTNHLFLENSPYLLQHAHNPVNWYPWGELAFQRAKEKNLPVLLSVGYSTCHWCHVMEEESFEDLEIARYMNENYIAIKVDREERPDIDSIYMSTVQLMTGRGGWPMTVWLTPDKKAFYGGTYFPARTGDRGLSVGFLSLLQNLKKLYDEEPEIVKQDGENLQKAIRKNFSISSTSHLVPDESVFQDLYKIVEAHSDPVYGGMKGAPKFPSSFPARFLLRSYVKTKKPLTKLHSFLEGLLKGGIHDQVGGGFHRYSTDEKWLVPHFEKMLYDQALLALVYLEAYQLTKKESYKQVAQGILDYVIRDMSAKDGGFFSATDADSLSHMGEKEEGYYFTWTPEEIEKALDKKSAQLVKNYYNITAQGNFEKRNILYQSKKLSEASKELGLSPVQAQKLLDSAHQILYETRELRPKPLRDEKILSAWNGLMISAFVYGFFVFNEKKYLSQAEKSAQFIWDQMYKNDQLYRVWKDDRAYIPAYLNDYAFFAAALLDLYEWTGHIKWLKRAIKLDKILEEEFEDKKEGGFFMTAKSYKPLLVREKPSYDGAEPSGNAVALMNLLRLAELSGNNHYKQRAEKTLKSFGSLIEKHPLSFSEWLLALDYYHSRVHEIVLVLADGTNLDSDPLFNELKSWYLPHKVLSLVYHSEVEEQSKLLKPIKRKTAIDGKSTVYICEEGACQLPVLTVNELREQLKNIPFNPRKGTNGI